jgi:hypothetical protein
MQMIKTLLKAPIKFYALAISPLIGPRCRYVPSCSCYAQQAIDRHGPFKGVILGALRLSRCHSLSKHPVEDPVPAQFNWPIDLRRLIRYKRGT